MQWKANDAPVSSLHRPCCAECSNSASDLQPADGEAARWFPASALVELWPRDALERFGARRQERSYPFILSSAYVDDDLWSSGDGDSRSPRMGSNLIRHPDPPARPAIRMGLVLGSNLIGYFRIADEV